LFKSEEYGGQNQTAYRRQASKFPSNISWRDRDTPNYEKGAGGYFQGKHKDFSKE